MKNTALVMGGFLVMTTSLQAIAQRPDREARESRSSSSSSRSESSSSRSESRPSRSESSPSRSESRPSRSESRPAPTRSETRPSAPTRTEPTVREPRAPRTETRPTPSIPTRTETRPTPSIPTRTETRPSQPTRRPEARPTTPTRGERPAQRPSRPSTPSRAETGRAPYRRVVVSPRPNRPVVRPHRPEVTRIRVIRYARPLDYHRMIARNHIYRHWIFSPVPRYYGAGYRVMDNYPWYIHNNYRYRYSPVETCTYDLVDSDTDTQIRSYGEIACNLAYDLCAADRDAANAGTAGDERYFCAERVGDDYVNNDDTIFNTNDDEMSDAQMERIEQYLDRTSDAQAYQDAVARNLGACTVWKLRGNVNGCTYRVKVNGSNFPDAAGLVCSAPEQAAIIGCNVGTEQENAGCILKSAVMNGNCI